MWRDVIECIFIGTLFIGGYAYLIKVFKKAEKDAAYYEKTAAYQNYKSEIKKLNKASK
jgi:hypothetical protein